METKLEQIAAKAVKQRPKSVVREIRTPRSVETGGGRPPPVTRWAPSNGCPYRNRQIVSGFKDLVGDRSDSGMSSEYCRNEHCRRRPSCIGGTQLIDDHEVTQIALPQEQTHPTGRARACGRLSQPASNRRCPMNLPSAIPPGQAKTPPPVWVTNWFSMSNFANLSKILMKPVRRSRW